MTQVVKHLPSKQIRAHEFKSYYCPKQNQKHFVCGTHPFYPFSLLFCLAMWGYTTIYFFILLLVDVCLWLNMSLHIFCYIALVEHCVYVLYVAGYISSIRISGSWVMYLFNFFVYCQPVSHRHWLNHSLLVTLCFHLSQGIFLFFECQLTPSF
jgi:hypothetical protein